VRACRRLGLARVEKILEEHPHKAMTITSTKHGPRTLLDLVLDPGARAGQDRETQLRLVALLRQHDVPMTTTDDRLVKTWNELQRTLIRRASMGR
jgi:hypothetical protein